VWVEPDRGETMFNMDSHFTEQSVVVSEEYDGIVVEGETAKSVADRKPLAKQNIHKTLK